MSIDVEDWFQVENLKAAIARETWKTRQLRVERNMDRLLALMAERGVRSTCFVLGWIAERCPALVERIAAEGHEVASHGYGHELLDTLTPRQFRADVERSRRVLQDITGSDVVGYRAPAFSIKAWSIPILAELGFSYDSSSFPAFAHDRYGRLTGLSADESVELRPGFHEVSVSPERRVSPAAMGRRRLLPAYSLPGLPPASGGSCARVSHTSSHPPLEIDASQPRVQGLGGAIASVTTSGSNGARPVRVTASRSLVHVRSSSPRARTAPRRRRRNGRQALAAPLLRRADPVHRCAEERLSSGHCGQVDEPSL
jgi:polysaccharide deacetylase family protein (PEP-CTERM system associated)